MPSKKKTIGKVQRVYNAATEDQATGQNSRRSFEKDCHFYGKMCGLTSEDFDLIRGMTIGEVMAMFEEVRLPFDPKMTGNITQEKYAAMMEDRQRKMLERIVAL